MRHYANRDLQWQGDWLCLRQRKIVQIVRDQQYPSMWRTASRIAPSSTC